MKNLSFWAKTHPLQARWLITLSHVILCFLGCILGFWLWLNEFEYSLIMRDVFTTLFLLGLIAYPLKGAVHVFWRHNYTKQKAMDAVLVFSGFLALSALVNLKLEQVSQYSASAQAIQIASKPDKDPATLFTFLKENTSRHALRKNFRMLKQEWKLARKIAKNGGGDNALKILFTFLILLLAAGLGILILIWACDLSCSGQEGAANLVGFGGGGLIILLTVLGIRAIWKKRKKPVEPAPN